MSINTTLLKRKQLDSLRSKQQQLARRVGHLAAGTSVRMITSQWPDLGWRADGTIGAVNDSSSVFKVRSGNNQGGTVSFEAVGSNSAAGSPSASAAFFLRHKNGALVLDEDDGSELFKQDSSWIARPGLLNSTASWASVRAVNYPQAYVRHKDGVLVLSEFPDSGDDQLAADGSFHLEVTARSPFASRGDRTPSPKLDQVVLSV